VVSGEAFRGDVSNLADLDRLYAKVKEQNDRIGILFANAGLGEIAPLEAITETHFGKTFSVNVKGLLFTVQKALPLYRNGGSIILNASIAASKAADGYSVYGASKAAVRSFARSWALELRHRKIRVNAISPGPIDTPGHKGFVSGLAQDEKQVQQIRKSIESNVPLGRL
jgi:NAD(P)-dependent dehydrogenase (short-subunit alcohol dehydrogenase family)